MYFRISLCTQRTPLLGHVSVLGVHVLPYAYLGIYICAARETPIFSPKFPLQSISFSQMTKIYSAPEHHHFSVARQILHFLPLRRPSFSKFLHVLAIHHRPRPAYCSQLERFQRPGISGRPECQPDASYKSAPETPISGVARIFFSRGALGGLWFS